jgi:hypothetical protein
MDDAERPSATAKGPGEESMSVGNSLKDNQHWIGIAGILVGAAISISTWVATREVGEITLKFNTVKIAQAGVPNIRILDNKNNPIMGNVFGCEIVVWNTGNLSLGQKADRIRQPLTVVFTGDVNIIDATIQDTKNVPFHAITLDRQKSQLTIGWSQFDPGDAIKVFAIYASAAQSPITYEGRFLQTKLNDMSEFKEEQPGLANTISNVAPLPRSLASYWVWHLAFVLPCSSPVDFASRGGQCRSAFLSSRCCLVVR